MCWVKSDYLLTTNTTYVFKPALTLIWEIFLDIIYFILFIYLLSFSSKYQHWHCTANVRKLLQINFQNSFEVWCGKAACFDPRFNIEHWTLYLAVDIWMLVSITRIPSVLIITTWHLINFISPHYQDMSMRLLGSKPCNCASVAFLAITRVGALKWEWCSNSQKLMCTLGVHTKYEMVWNYVSKVNPCLSLPSLTSTFSCNYNHIFMCP